MSPIVLRSLLAGAAACALALTANRPRARRPHLFPRSTSKAPEGCHPHHCGTSRWHPCPHQHRCHQDRDTHRAGAELHPGPSKAIAGSAGCVVSGRGLPELCWRAASSRSLVQPDEPQGARFYSRASDRRPAQLLRRWRPRPAGQRRADRAPAWPASRALFRRRQCHRRCHQCRLEAADGPPLRRVWHHGGRPQLLFAVVRHQSAPQHRRDGAVPHHRPVRGDPVQHPGSRPSEPFHQSDPDVHQQCRDIADHSGQLLPPRPAGL